MLWYESHGQNARACARHFGIAPKTLYHWSRRFDSTNVRSLENKSHRPLRVRQKQISSLQLDRILALKKAHLRWGKQKIATLYSQDFGEAISSWKVQKVIEQYHLYYHPIKQARINKKRALSLKRKKITELKTKPRLGFLWCLDTVVLYGRGVKRYIFTGIDKYSKLAWARMYSTKSSFNARDFLLRLNYLSLGKIENLGHDNGSEFKGYFQGAARELKLPQYHSRLQTPKDNATNERFNRTLQEEFIQMGNFSPRVPAFNQRLTEWLIEYNFKRPHQTLGYMSPINFIYKHQKLLPITPSSTRS
jgi:transposase InsO family protein